MRHYSLRDASPTEARKELDRIKEITRTLIVEESKGVLYPNCDGTLVPLTTPRGMLLGLEAIGTTMISIMEELVLLSYPEVPIHRRKQLEEILYGVAGDLKTGHFNSVLWNPDIWDAAVSGSKSFQERACEPADLPAVEPKPMVWWHALSRSMEENPFDRESHWWTPDWELHGLYIYASERMRLNSLTGNHNSTGVISFWFEGGQNGTGNMRVALEPGIQEGQPLGDFYSILAAGEAFLKLPFVDSRVAPSLNHHDRKQYARAKRTPPEVRTVTLRRSAQAENALRAHPGEVPEGSRRLSCRFLVGGSVGFWRKAKSNSRSGNPEYVMPYLKGPEDAPFRPPQTRTVAVAKR